jgi:uncharacterized protein with ParB-like and HNH nuclease domain
MNANPWPFLNIFERKQRIEVPLFQRQYVWNQGDQWEPLWEDISRKFTDALSDRQNAPPHFLGAMVLDQKLTPITSVEKRQVIDGQQRLITFQIFLSAFRDLCNSQGCKELSDECHSFILNKGMMDEPSVEKYKVWPTQLDRQQFTDVVSAGSRADLEKKYPLTYKKYARKPEERPRMVEAYIYFYDRLSEFFLGSGSEKPLAEEMPLASRMEKCFQVLKNALLVVVIDLGPEDDPQVIFETLNARGEPLLPADLIRNYIFLRAARQNLPQEDLYNEYWKKFDDPFWRKEERQGRLTRPRLDLFVQHFLSSQEMADVAIKHLYVEYKNWIQLQKPFQTVRDEMATVSRLGDAYRRLIDPQDADFIYPLASFLKSFDMSTAYPALLYMLDTDLSEADWRQISSMLESYLVRRAVCNLTSKNYNRNFLGMIRHMNQNGHTATSIGAYLAGLTGDSGEWPSDETFQRAWLTNQAYLILGNKLVHIFRRLDDSYFSEKNERLGINSPMTIEHLMPQGWRDKWPLPDGSKGLTWEEMIKREDSDPQGLATRARDSIIHTMGNLTVLTQPLNSAVSDSPWAEKKPELLKSSLLPINSRLHDYDRWDEGTIVGRGKELLEHAKAIWPKPVF